jgi:hypothetical protein
LLGLAAADRRKFGLAFSGEDLGEVRTAAEVEVGFLLDTIEHGERFKMLMLGLGGIGGQVRNSAS